MSHAVTAFFSFSCGNLYSYRGNQILQSNNGTIIISNFFNTPRRLLSLKQLFCLFLICPIIVASSRDAFLFFSGQIERYRTIDKALVSSTGDSLNYRSLNLDQLFRKFSPHPFSCESVDFLILLLSFD